MYSQRAHRALRQARQVRYVRNARRGSRRASGSSPGRAAVARACSPASSVHVQSWFFSFLCEGTIHLGYFQMCGFWRDFPRKAGARNISRRDAENAERGGFSACLRVPLHEEFARLADRGAPNPPNGGGDVARVYTLEGGDPLVEVRQQHHDLLNSHLSFSFLSLFRGRRAPAWIQQSLYLI